MRRSTTLAVGILAVGTLALCPVARAEPANGDVSQIHGQLVPVGEHDEFRYSFRRFNVSANPLGWMLGLYGVSASYGFHDNLALRVDANYYAPPGANEDGFELGVGLPIYLRRTYRGPFLEPGFVGRRIGDGEFASTQVGPQVLAGWQWGWDSGFNIAIAAGVGRNLIGDRDGYDSEVFPNGYLRFGYAF